MEIRTRRKKEGRILRIKPPTTLILYYVCSIDFFPTAAAVLPLNKLSIRQWTLSFFMHISQKDKKLRKIRFLCCWGFVFMHHSPVFGSCEGFYGKKGGGGRVIFIHTHPFAILAPKSVRSVGVFASYMIDKGLILVNSLILA